jgi:hypothetical protein
MEYKPQNYRLIQKTLYKYSTWKKSIHNTHTNKMQNIFPRFFCGEGLRSRSYWLTAALKAYCATLWWRWSERWLVFFSKQWSTGGMTGKPKYSGGKPVPMPHCPPQIPHGLTPESNPGLCGGRPATNRLSHGTAISRIFILIDLFACWTMIDFALFIPCTVNEQFTTQRPTKCTILGKYCAFCWSQCCEMFIDNAHNKQYKKWEKSFDSWLCRLSFTR